VEAVNGVGPAQRSTSAPPTAVEPVRGSNETPGLPGPADGALPADPLSWLYLFESTDRQLGVGEGTKKLLALQSEGHQKLLDEQQAIGQAIAAESSHSFWDDLGGAFGQIAKVAAVVASLAAVVATAGAATPIAAIAIGGAVLSSAGFVDGEVHVLQKLGVDDRTAGWIDVGLSTGGAICSAGAGVVAGGRAASSAISALERGGAVVAGAGAVGKGASVIAAGAAQARADQAQADAIAGRAQSDHLQRMILLLIDRTRDSDGESNGILRTIARTKTIQADTLSGVSSVRG
jgi:hypothetical protein